MSKYVASIWIRDLRERDFLNIAAELPRSIPSQELVLVLGLLPKQFMEPVECDTNVPKFYWAADLRCLTKIFTPNPS